MNIYFSKWEKNPIVYERIKSRVVGSGGEGILRRVLFTFLSRNISKRRKKNYERPKMTEIFAFGKKKKLKKNKKKFIRIFMDGDYSLIGRIRR